ncbi:MAG TPA: ABC transporter substrate-binding protein [Gemmatimonadaceae bacterium]|nr:ABC transporter substrate-binding protein [Gemmatimonadaceae bacterium]
MTVLLPGDESTIWSDAPQFLLFLPLVARNEKGEVEGRLARSWEHSPDYRSWTIHLRTDVRWHDGVPVTAHDAAFTLELHRRAWLQGARVYSVAVLDDSTYTLTYHRRGPGSPLDEWMVYLPKHLLEGLDPDKYASWEFWKAPVGNGPYRFVRRIPNTAMIFEANPEYYRGRPRIDRVIVKLAPEPSTTELVSGNVDAVAYVNPGSLLQLKADARFHAYSSFARGGVFTAVYWNHRHAAFRDPRVRRALTLAIDRRELHRVGNLPETTPVFDVIFTERQLDRGELPAPLPYDTVEAARLLDEAGWRDTDGDGVRDRAGRQFHFSLLMMTGGWTAGTSRHQAALFIQSQLRRVGIRMEILSMDMLAGRDRWRRGEFDAAIVTSLGGENANPIIFGKKSLLGYANLRVGDLLERTTTSMNPDERDSIYRELWPIFQAEIPMTPLYPAQWTYVVHRRVRGLSSPFRSDPLWYMDELWVEEDGQR